MSGAHYHIRWSDLALLDFEPFTTAAEADAWAANKIVRSGETYSVEEFDRDCIRCKFPNKDSLREVLAGAIRKAEAEFGILQVLNEDTGTLRIVAQKGFSPRFLECFAAVHENFAACGTTLKRRERVLVNNVTTDPIFKEKSLLEIMRGEEVRSVQSLPLFTSSGCLVGVLAVHYRACDMPSISAHQLEPSYVQDVADHLHQFTRWQSGKLLERVVPIPRFDIFSGQIDKNASRIETIEGLGNAYELMTKLAERSPGSYFIRDSRTHIIRGSIDTSIRPQRST